MSKIIRFVCIGFVAFISVATPAAIKAQSKPDAETTERICSFWSLTMEQVKIAERADEKEFGIYNRFYAHQIDSTQTEFSKGMFNGSITLSNVKDYMAIRKIFLTGLFEKFRKIESEYPSSVDEYRTYRRPRLGADSCFPACYNSGFEDGTFNGWYGYYAVNNSPTTGFDITGITGGYLGGVTRAAQDPNTGGSYQLRITSGTATDWFLDNYSTYTMSQVSPFGGNHSVMMGDSVGNLQGVSILSQSFMVTSPSASITYQYAAFLENPVPPHSFYQQPFFLVGVLDQNGDTIPGCGTYSKSATYAQQGGFIGIPYPVNGDSIFWRNWSFVNVPLKGYQGQCVTVIFEVLDCALGGHCGYAYVDANCSPENVISSSPAFCGQDSIVLTAPQGWGRYFWYGNPSNGIISNDTLQTIDIDSVGTYNVVLTSYSGLCKDTLTIRIDSAPGPIPQPSFHANTVCAGQNVTFINTSNPINGTFYWDFYNGGTYQDSLITNPTWSYAAPGTYVVKLYEINNGCGSYAYDTITVDTALTGSFSYTNSGFGGCAPATIQFTDRTTGYTTFFWNFGDPSSGTLDTSSTVTNPTHVYDTGGTYVAYLIVNNGGGCPDTVRETIVIAGVPKPVITGGDSVCSGGVDTLSVLGISGATYLWSPGGQTSSSITVSISGTTVYSVSVGTVCGTGDTTFTVYLTSPVVASIGSNRNNTCAGDTVVISAGGGGTYVWNTGATSSSITVYPIDTTSYTVHVFAPGTTCSDSATITVDVTPSITATITASPDSLCAGGTTTLSVSSSGTATSYLWSTGSTASSITVSPITTTTYYVLVAGSCGRGDSVAKVVTIEGIPVPRITGRDSVCGGSVDTLIASGGGTYLWSTGQTTATITVPVTGATTYTVTVSNGCASRDTTFTVNTSPPPIALLNANNNSICNGDTVTMTAGGGSSYLWSTGSTSTTIQVHPSTTTSYTLHVYAGSLCSDSAVITITVNQKITSTVSATSTSICVGSSTTLSVNSNGGPPDYLWNNGSTASSITVNPTSTTTYYVIVSGTCANDSIAQVINVNTVPLVTITYPDTSCIGAAIVLTANGASSYTWGNGSTTNPITVSLTADSTITVIGSNGGCSDTASKIIHVYPGLVSAGVLSDSTCAGGNATISVSVTGGHPAYSYAWNNGITSNSPGPITVPVPPNTYVCTVTDACGQTLSETVNITVRPAPNIVFYASPDSVLGGGYVTFINLTTGASGYLWNLGDGTTVSDTAPFYQYNQAGVYVVTLTATNSYGCRDTASIDVYVIQKIVIPNVFTPNGDNVNDVFQVQAGGMKVYDIQIFDRWGVKVFESDSPNISWTGRSSSGELESNGTYYYVIQASDYNGKAYNFHGYVQLIR